MWLPNFLSSKRHVFVICMTSANFLLWGIEGDPEIFTPTLTGSIKEVPWFLPQSGPAQAVPTCVPLDLSRQQKMPAGWAPRIEHLGLVWTILSSWRKATRKVRSEQVGGDKRIDEWIPMNPTCTDAEATAVVRTALDRLFKTDDSFRVRVETRVAAKAAAQLTRAASSGKRSHRRKAELPGAGSADAAAGGDSRAALVGGGWRAADEASLNASEESVLRASPEARMRMCSPALREEAELMLFAAGSAAVARPDGVAPTFPSAVDVPSSKRARRSSPSDLAESDVNCLESLPAHAIAGQEEARPREESHGSPTAAALVPTNVLQVPLPARPPTPEESAEPTPELLGFPGVSGLMGPRSSSLYSNPSVVSFAGLSRAGSLNGIDCAAPPVQPSLSLLSRASSIGHGPQPWAETGVSVAEYYKSRGSGYEAEGTAGFHDS